MLRKTTIHNQIIYSLCLENWLGLFNTNFTHRNDVAMYRKKKKEEEERAQRAMARTYNKSLDKSLNNGKT